MSVRVGFLTTLKVNVGDEFIREGIRAVLDRVGVPYRPFYVNKHDPRTIGSCPVEDEVEVLADKFWECDVFVQAGAPVYWHLMGGRHTSLTSDWHDWVWERRILRSLSGREGGGGPAFVNLGAGSCDPWGGTGEGFLGDAGCAAFARKAGERARVTTVRDPLAGHILRQLGVAHEEAACPAFLAGARHRPMAQAGEVVGVNLMPLGGHFDLTGGFDAAAWRGQCLDLCRRLRRLGPLLFVCHDAAEVEYCSALALPGERVFVGGGWREYLDAYAQCAVVVANRVHGAVVAAGMGVPSVILGTDTRARIGEYLGVPGFRSGGGEIGAVFERAEDAFRHRADERERLLKLRDESVVRYASLLEPVMAEAARRTGTDGPAPARVEGPRGPRLASVAELESARFAGVMADLNAFAARHGLRQHTDWSAAWEYPWLWYAVLGRLDWRGRRLLDVGGGPSPLPWFLAARGARLALCEAHADLHGLWDRVRAELGVEAEHHVTPSSGTLPLPDESVDVVTSLSSIEHQPDKAKAVAELARVLRPGGVLAMSFDVCEPSLGMTFPEWNGSALTMDEFERVVWRHPAFDGGADGWRVEWNVQDVEPFLAWHRRPAPHHNYVTAAAVLIKR